MLCQFAHLVRLACASAISFVQNDLKRLMLMKEILLILGAVTLIIHGLMELAPLLFLFRKKNIMQGSEKGIPKFIFEPLRNNVRQTMIIGVIFGFLRVISAIAIFVNLMWGWSLAVVISIVTLIVMTLFLPMGIVDGILSSVALVCLLISYFGNKAIM